MAEIVYKPRIEAKNATVDRYTWHKKCVLCSHKFESGEKFRIVEEGSSYDENWFAVCKPCTGQPVYSNFIRNNCKIL